MVAGVFAIFLGAVAGGILGGTGQINGPYVAVLVGASAPAPPRAATHTTATRPPDRRARLHVNPPPANSRWPDQRVRTRSSLTRRSESRGRLLAPHSR